MGNKQENDGTNQIPILLLDGGLGTTLSSEPYNVTYNEQTPLWSSHLLISAPETLVAVHREFMNAGADIILTATYQASSKGFARTPRLASSEQSHYSEDEAKNYMRSAINLVQQASSQHTPKSSIALSLGAYGAILSPSQEFSGNYPKTMSVESALSSWHKARLNIFQRDKPTWSAISYLAFETVRPIAEIYGIRKAMLGISDTAWWISHVVPDDISISGIPEVVEAMLQPRDGYARPWAIGVNCTAVGKIAQVEALYRATIADRFPELVGEIWLVMYPDGTRGEVYDTVSMQWVKNGKDGQEGEWEDVLMNVVVDARDSKVWKGIIVGGCCKTLPKDIKKLRARLDKLQQS